MTTPWLLIAPLVILAATAPFGATLCGAISISQIRHSGGRLTGLGLALADALVFPLLILDGLIVAGCYYGLHAALDSSEAMQHFGHEPVQLHHRTSDVWVLLLAITICLLLNVPIVRWAWRAASKPLGVPTGGNPPPLPHAAAGAASVRLIMTGLLHATAIAALLGFFLFAAPHFESIFKDFRAELPSSTRTTLVVARWLSPPQNGWVLVVPFAFTFLAMDLWVCWILDRTRLKFLRWTWVLMVLLGIAAILALGIWSLALPMRDLVAPVVPAGSAAMELGPALAACG